MEKYKKYLDEATNNGLGYDDVSLSRYISFSICRDNLNKNSKILELGTTRSFVDGKYEGCNLDDLKYWKKNNPEMWDWGAGCFTILFGEYNLTSVDLIESHVKRSKHMTQSLGLNIKYAVSDSINYLNSTNEKFDLIYLDTGDMHPIEPTIELQLQEAIIIVEKKLLNNNGKILIDDVLNATPRNFGKNNKYGKSEKSIPYLLKNGFKISFSGYQYILEK
jgi:hypothetical protein